MMRFCKILIRMFQANNCEGCYVCQLNFVGPSKCLNRLFPFGAKSIIGMSICVDKTGLEYVAARACSIFKSILENKTLRGISFHRKR